MAVPPGDSSLMTLSWRERDSNRRSPQDSDTFETTLFAAGEPTLLPKALAVRTLLPPLFQAEPYPLRPGARRQRGPARSADGRCTSAECLNGSSTTRSDRSL